MTQVKDILQTTTNLSLENICEGSSPCEFLFLNKWFGKNPLQWCHCLLKNRGSAVQFLSQHYFLVSQTEKTWPCGQPIGSIKETIFIRSSYIRTKGEKTKQNKEVKWTPCTPDDRKGVSESCRELSTPWSDGDRIQCYLNTCSKCFGGK